MTTKTAKPLTRKAILAVVRKPPRGGDYVWDGIVEDERPASREELAPALARKRGRPLGSGTKEQVAIRLDRDLLEQLRATGPGWQTRVNEAVRVWLRSEAASDASRRLAKGKA